MYAIIDDRGKQYKVEEGAKILIDLTKGDPGAEMRFENVILLSTDKGVKIEGSDLEGTAVLAVIEGEVKDKKIYGRHRTLRNRTQTRTGHRQKYTEIRITKIEA